MSESQIKLIINKTENYSGLYINESIPEYNKLDDSVRVIDISEEEVLAAYIGALNTIQEHLEEDDGSPALPKDSGYYILVYTSENQTELASNSVFNLEENLCQEIVEVRNAPTDDKIVKVLHNNTQYNLSSYREHQVPIYMPLPAEYFNQ